MIAGTNGIQTPVRERLARAICKAEFCARPLPPKGMVWCGPSDAQAYADKYWHSQLIAVDAVLDELFTVDHQMIDAALRSLPMEPGTAARFWLAAGRYVKEGK